jgi:hypothetical protein
MATIFCVAGVLVPIRVPALLITDSLFAFNVSSETNRFVGASFVPSVAPVVHVVHQGGATVLTWDPVAFSGGGVVMYVVRRISPNGTVAIVCSGAESPLLQFDGLMRCVDGGSGGRKNLEYSEQPVVMRNGVESWSLEPSVPARGN